MKKKLFNYLNIYQIVFYSYISLKINPNNLYNIMVHYVKDAEHGEHCMQSISMLTVS